MSKTMSIEQIVEQISGLSLLEVADLVKALEEKFGVSAAMSMSAPAAGAAEAGAAAAEEKSEFKVELIEAGSEKMKVIKALREVKKDIGLIDAKKMVEEAPSVIAEAVSKDDAKVMKEKLEAAGAKVKLS
jgi:large subunit ribosomal protein L7/L12